MPYRRRRRRAFGSPVRRASGMPLGRGGAGKLRLLIMLGIAGFALMTYFGQRQENPFTGEMQHVNITMEQEIALGLQSAPEMAAQHGGFSYDERKARNVERIGRRLLTRAFQGELPYPFEFHLLADTETVNAFALPGGQIFITSALYDRLETEGQVAGVLGHEIGHVIERHGAEHLAKAQLTQSLTGAAVIATYDPGDPNSRAAAGVAMAVGQLVNMHYGREDELESDTWGVALTGRAGYDPRGMVRVMEILAEAAGKTGRQPEFFSTHPNPDRRIERILEAIETEYPQGLPGGLTP